MAKNLINTLGGTSGFGINSLNRSDDGNFNVVEGAFRTAFPDGINFFGANFVQAFINNNGNLTFNSAISSTQGFNFTTNIFQPIIAPYWADVETTIAPAGGTAPGGNSTGSNLVWFHLDATARVFTVTWDDVGRFNDDNSVRNAFQLRLIQANVLDNQAASTDFDIEFRYEDINWAVNSSGNGVPTLGFAKGTGVEADAVRLPQSNDAAQALTLENQTNINDPGRFLFNIRNGVAILPTNNAERMTGTNDGEAFSALGGNDTLLGYGGNDSLFGGGGNDSMIGGAGIDGLFGNAGNDVLDGGADGDLMDGDADNDTLIGGGGADQLRGGDGMDFASYQTALNVGVIVSLVAGTVGAGGDATGDTFTGIEGLIGSNFNDTLYGNTGANTLEGGDGFDVVFGDGGGGVGDSDMIRLGEGNDAAAGEDGNDTIFGGNGTEYLYGGYDTDLLWGEDGVDFLFGEEDSDVLYGGNSTDGLSGGEGIDYLFGQAGTDYLYGDADTDFLYGGEEFDFIYGGAGVDALFGEGGGDLLAGEADTDYIAGGEGDDFIFGGDGVDFMYGEGGNDVSTGGLGTADAFYHQAVTGGNDQITDFEVALDVLVLLGTGFASSAQAIANASFTANGASLATGAGTSVLLIGISVADLNAGNVFIG